MLRPSIISGISLGRSLDPVRCFSLHLVCSGPFDNILHRCHYPRVTLGSLAHVANGDASRVRNRRNSGDQIQYRCNAIRGEECFNSIPLNRRYRPIVKGHPILAGAVLKNWWVVQVSAHIFKFYVAMDHPIGSSWLPRRHSLLL